MGVTEADIARAFTDFLSETKFLSNPEAGLASPAGKTLIAGGIDTVRYMFISGARLTVHDMAILSVITGAEPIASEHSGIVTKMEEDWRAWAKQNAYL